MILKLKFWKKKEFFLDGIKSDANQLLWVFLGIFQMSFYGHVFSVYVVSFKTYYADIGESNYTHLGIQNLGFVGQWCKASIIAL